MYGIYIITGVVEDLWVLLDLLGHYMDLLDHRDLQEFKSKLVQLVPKKILDLKDQLVQLVLKKPLELLVQ
jgi:hypothetical protein